MNTRSKIVGLTRHSPEPDTAAGPLEDAAGALAADEIDGGGAYSPEYFVTYTDERTPRDLTKYLVPGILLVAFIGWTGFFGWTYFPEAQGGLTNPRIITLIAMWAIPTLLLAVLWLLAMRSSTREAARFGDVALLLRNESDALATRMRTVNEEISLARDFLAQNARELETVGKQSSRQLVESAELLAEALADSDNKAKTLETVSNAANTNLEQLRKHLPVVTSAAKDVTNQIGSAGNSAQIQIKALIAALERVGDAGKTARDYIDNMEVRANEVSSNLEQSLNSSSAMLEERGEKALKHSAEMGELISRATGDLTAAAAAASTRIETTLEGSQQRLESQLALIQNSLADLGKQTDDEEARIARVISEISNHIETSATRISEVDRLATDQTAKLAFAVSALGESTKDVGSALANNQNITQNLISESDKLLDSLGSVNQEIGDAIPSTLGRLGEQIRHAIARLNQARSGTEAIDNISDNVLAKLNSLDHLVQTQRSAIEKLMVETDEHFSSRQKQADALGTALEQTHSLIGQMNDDANGQLVASLIRVGETARNAAENSRQILDEELANVADRLIEQNKAALGKAVDDQIAAMNNVVSEAVERNIKLSEDAASRVAAQLGQLDEMTSNMEQRIADGKENFDAVGDDSFARRMVLLTESLNSTSIDVAKILSNDVTDTAWAAYLKGDRGVFTRRAVRLLDAGEARAVAAHYGDDSEFREHVNRYIHDFEAMMRVLLSTRDGNAIGVTLLSSDVGKLYVALAQAIERLRN